MAILQIRVDDKLKAEADALFADIGLDTPTAIRAFLKQSVMRDGLPFALTKETPNAVTLAAMREVAEMEKHPEAHKGYADVDEMMKELLN